MRLLQEAAQHLILSQKPDLNEDVKRSENGPAAACVFNWNGKGIELQPVRARVVEFLWGHINEQVPIENAIEPVWLGKHPTDNAIWANISKLNTRFDQERVPIFLSYRKAHLLLEMRETG